MSADCFNNNLKHAEDFRDGLTDEILTTSVIEPILNEVNNYTILLKEMNQESVYTTNVCDDIVSKSGTDSKEMDISENAKTAESNSNESEIYEDEDQTEGCIVEKHNTTSEPIPLEFTSLDQKFVTCSVCNVKLLKKSYKRHFVTQHKHASSNDYLKRNTSTKRKGKTKVRKCLHCKEFFSSSNLQRHMRRFHSDSLSTSESNPSNEDVENNVCVNIEHIKIDKVRIRPEDPVKDRERLTLVKDGGNSYKILDSNNTCKICHRSFGSNEYKLLRHYSVDHFKEEMLKYVKEDDLKCQFCGLLCADLNILVGHIGPNHHKIEEYLIDFEEDTESKICDLAPAKESPIELECGHCQQKFKFRSLLYQHYSRQHYEKEMRTFIDEQSNICKFCGILIRKSKYMIAHVGSVHDKVEEFLPDQFKIEKKTTVQPKELAKDGKESTESEDVEIENLKVVNYLPEEYNTEKRKFSKKKSSINKTGIAKQIKKKASKKNILTANRNPNVNRGLRCTICLKSGFFNRNNLLRHYASTHFKEKLLPFADVESLTCLICQKKLSSLRQLLLHIGSYHNKLEGLLPENENQPSKCRNRILPAEERNEGDYLCPFCDENVYFNSQKDLFKHYSGIHYQTELAAFVGDNQTCSLCQDGRSRRNLLIHLGVEHNLVEQFTPELDVGRMKIRDVDETNIENEDEVDDLNDSNLEAGSENVTSKENADYGNTEYEEVEMRSDLLTILKVEEGAVTLKERVVSNSIVESVDVIEDQTTDNFSSDSLIDEIRNILESDSD